MARSKGMATVDELFDDLKRAVARENTIRVVLKSAQREKIALVNAREGTGKKPDAFEHGVAKGIWGLKEYLHAAENETKRVFVMVATEVVLKEEQGIKVKAVEDYRRSLREKKAAKETVVVVDPPKEVDVKVVRKTYKPTEMKNTTPLTKPIPPHAGQNRSGLAKKRITVTTPVVEKLPKTNEPAAKQRVTVKPGKGVSKVDSDVVRGTTKVAKRNYNRNGTR